MTLALVDFHTGECSPRASEESLTHNYNVNDISSNSWGSNRCEEYATSATDCPFECPSVSSADCPCDACDGDDWASGQLSSTCEDAVVDYCTSYFNDDVTPCLELDHYFVQCGYWQLASSLHDSLVDGATNGRGGLGTVYVFAAGNSYDVGQDVNYAGYQNSRFTITVGAVHADMTHSDYSSSGAPVFISAPGGDGGNMAVAKPVGNGVTDNCADAGQGTSFAAPLVSGVAALMLEANPTLTWRDVQGVLAATARTDFNDEDDETGQWTTNQAGVKHSYKYGFGLVDALAAVTAATTWTTLPAEITLVTATTSGAALLDFDGTEHWVESEAAEFGSSDFVIEGVSVYVTIEHPRRGDLRIELERNGVTSLLTDDKLELGSGYTNWKFTTLRHWGETADNGAFTLRVADRRAGSGDDDDLGSRRRLDADDGVLVKWTLQLYGHDSDTSTPWTPQPTPRGGCDSVAVSGSTSQTSRHGTYLPDGRCEDKVYYKCSDCSSTHYLWYYDSHGRWYMGPDADGCASTAEVEVLLAVQTAAPCVLRDHEVRRNLVHISERLTIHEGDPVLLVVAVRAAFELCGLDTVGSTCDGLNVVHGVEHLVPRLHRACHLLELVRVIHQVLILVAEVHQLPPASTGPRNGRHARKRHSDHVTSRSLRVSRAK